MKNIKIENNTYLRRAEFDEAFETPDAAINRVLIIVDDNDSLNIEIKTKAKAKTTTQVVSKPSIIFNPPLKKIFLSCLVESRLAEVVINKNNGERDIIQWKATRMTLESNLMANVQHKFLKKWKEKNISGLELSVYNYDDFQGHYKDFELSKAVSIALGLKFSELQRLNWAITYDEHCSGKAIGYRIYLGKDSPSEILDLLDSIKHRHVKIPLDAIDEDLIEHMMYSADVMMLVSEYVDDCEFVDYWNRQL